MKRSPLLILGGGRFNPAIDLPNTAIWLDGADLGSFTFNSGDVSQWNDKSGKGNHFIQATGSLQPAYAASAINGMGGPFFYDDGTAKNLARADNATLDYATFSLFVVMKRDTDLGATEHVAGKYAIGSPANQREHRVIVSSGDLVQTLYSTGGNADTVTVGPAGALATGSPQIVDAYYDGTNLVVAKNNGTAGSGAVAAPFNGTSSFFLGSRDGAANPFSGYVTELIFCTAVLNATQRLNALQYLSGKWGIAIA